MKELNLLSYYLYRLEVLSASIRIFSVLKCFLPLLLLGACTGAPKDDGTTPAPLFQKAQTIEANPPGGYTVNLVSGDSIQPIINFEGDALKTGVPIPVTGRVIHSDSVSRPISVPVAPKGQLTYKPPHQNQYEIPDNLTVIPVDESKLTYIRVPQVVEADTSHYIINSIGTTIPTGRSIPLKGKAVQATHPQPAVALLSQIKDAATANLQYLDVEQGMASSLVWPIVQDHSGNLWFGTDGGGVSKYDGKGFTHFTEKEGLSSNRVRSILEDCSGNLWFGTRNGVSKYDGKGFTHFTEKEGLSSNSVWSIVEDRSGNLWFGTDGGGAIKYDGEGFTHYTEKEGLSSNSVWSIVEDRSGNLWFGTWGGGVSKYDGAGFTHYTEKDGLSSNIVLSIVEDHVGDLWFGTYGSGVSKYDGAAFTQYTEKEGLSSNEVWSIVEDRSGNLWFGTDGGGVSKYDGEGFTHFTEKEGLSNNGVFSIIEDRIGNLWFGTWGGGVSKYYGEGFTHYSEKEGLSSNLVRSIVEDRSGNLWFATDGGGLSKYDGEGFTHITEKEGLSSNSVWSIVEDRSGNLWVGHWGYGVSKYDGEGFTHYTEKEGLSSNIVLSILEDRIGNLWFGTNGGGVSKYDGEGFTHYTEKEGLSSNSVWSIIEDHSGNLWFGTNGGGVTKYDGEGFTHYTEKEGLSSNSVFSIVEDRIGNLWFGTDGGGVSKYDGEGFTHYTEKGGLSSNIVSSIVEDKNVTNGIEIYLGTEKGITKMIIPPITTSEVEVSTLQVFEKQDGLKSLNALPNGAFIDSKNRAWWGMGKNLTMLDLNIQHKPAQDPPAVYLRQLAINGQFIDYRNRPDRLGDEIKFKGVQPFENYPRLLELPYDKNHLSFHFSAIDWSAPHKIRYSYRMLGLNDRWSTPAPEPKADYRNLPYGPFIFQIRAIGESGEWSEAFEYTFTIHPPWWRTWWAYFIYTVLFLGALLIFSKWREQNLRKEKEKLEGKVKERTTSLEKKSDELAHSLESLKSTQAQLIHSEKMASLGQLTAGIAHEIQNPLNFVNNFSELNVELIQELKEELENGNEEEVKLIANDLEGNEQKISEHGKRADAIVKGMLEHSRNHRGEKTHTDINALCDEYLRLAYHGMRAKDKSFNASLETDFDHSLEKIMIVPQDIGRVVLNIINNSLYAIKERQTKMGNSTYKPTIWVSTKKEKNKIAIRIKDNGMGIPDSVKTKIFQPFFTTKPTGQGTGLGLSLSYDIVKAHGGGLKVESIEGTGSEFIIKLLIA